MKSLARRRKREYKKKGRSPKYTALKEEFDIKEQKATNFLEKNVTEIKNTNPSKAYSIMKKLGGIPGESENQSGFVLPNHEKQNLSIQESSEAIADHFAKISQEFPPLRKDKLPNFVQK